MTFSRVLAIGDSREIGLYDVPMCGSLFGLGIGMILASFRICGMSFVFRDMLKKYVRYFMATGPRCFRCLILILSGPVELLFGALDIASDTWAGVMRMVGDVIDFVCLFVFLFVVLIACFIVFTNCLLKAVAFCCAVMAGMLLKVVMLFGGEWGFLPPWYLIVFQSVCVFCSLLFAVFLFSIVQICAWISFL